MTHTVDAAGLASVRARAGVSILLLTKNHIGYMRGTLGVLRHQDYEGPVEIVCVDSGSTDGTIEFLHEHGIATHSILPEEFHHARTRNLAASMAHHEILVLLSADAIPTSEQWLRKLVEPFEAPQVGGVYGKQIAPEGFGPLRTYALEYVYPSERQERFLEPGETSHIGMVRFSNANSAIRADLWRRFQFLETALVAEDQWICYNILKSGMKVVYEPEAAVIHGHERSIWGEFQWAVDNAISLQRMGVFDDPLFKGRVSYGLDRIRKEWRHFASRRQYGHALKGFLISAAKWAGIQIGRRERRLPACLLRRVSSNYMAMPR